MVLTVSDLFADISHHQTVADLAVYKAIGHTRIAFKATEGTTFVDTRFVERWQHAGRLGLDRIAYHYARAANDGGQEFDHFHNTINNAGGLTDRDTLCLDAEDPTTPLRAATHARQFTSRAINRGVPTGLIYTGRWYADPNRLTPDVFAPGWRKLWLSDYGNDSDTDIHPPNGWLTSHVFARQFTDRALVSGIGGRCDYNRVIYDWLNLPPITYPKDDEMYPIMVYAQGKPMYLYWPATGRLVGLGDTIERDVLKKVHAKAGHPIDELKLSVAELDQLIDFTRRAV
jgi:GH25 family lysozyme M1 (1,4-beta-N-acetylmuramidase)